MANKYTLIVTEPFGSYAKGDQITDQKEVKAVLDSDNAGHVVKTLQPDTPAA